MACDATIREAYAEALRSASPEIRPFVQDLADGDWLRGDDRSVEEMVGDLLEVAESDRQRDKETRGEEELAEIESEAAQADYEARYDTMEQGIAAVRAALDGSPWSVLDCNYSRSSFSRYLTLSREADQYGETITLRLSDHVAPEFGGFNPETQERSGRPDIDLVLSVGEALDRADLLRRLEELF